MPTAEQQPHSLRMAIRTLPQTPGDPKSPVVFWDEYARLCTHPKPPNFTTQAIEGQPDNNAGDYQLR